MPKRSRKTSLSNSRPDMNQIAARILAEATGATDKTPDPEKEKDPAAVALGRKGGLKGGKARAAKMTRKERVASAKKAAAARWGKKG